MALKHFWSDYNVKTSLDLLPRCHGSTVKTHEAGPEGTDGNRDREASYVRCVCGTHPARAGTREGLTQITSEDTLEPWQSTLLMLRPFNTVPHSHCGDFPIR